MTASFDEKERGKEGGERERGEEGRWEWGRKESISVQHKASSTSANTTIFNKRDEPDCVFPYTLTDW